MCSLPIFEDVSRENGFFEVIYINKNSCEKWVRTCINREFKVSMKKCENGTLELKIQAMRTPSACEKHIEFFYQLKLAHRFSLQMSTIEFRGKAIIDQNSNPIFVCYHKLPIYHRLRGVSFKYMHMLFGVIMDTYYDEDGIRNLLLTEDIRKHMQTVTNLKLRAPLLLEAIEAGEIRETTKNHLEVFIQLLILVQVQLKQENIKPLLKMATEYEAWNVKKYCELQLIWRDDFEFSKKWKFKLACECNLNILMNQLLKDVKTVKELVKLMKYTTGINSMDSNTCKLLIGKMYEL